MTINYNEPHFARLIDLLTHDAWVNMDEYSAEAIADRADCDFCCGASKAVFKCEAWDFVLKVPYYGDGATHDYCYSEMLNYEDIVKTYPEIAPLFAEVKFVGTFGEIKVYAQEKVAQKFSAWEYHISHEEWSKISDEAWEMKQNDPNYEKIVSELQYKTRLHYVFSHLVTKMFGFPVLALLCAWAVSSNENDLHSGNVGFTAEGQPKIFDYSGFYD